MEITASKIGTFQLAGSVAGTEEAQAENAKRQLEAGDTLSISSEGKEAASGLTVANLDNSGDAGYGALSIAAKSTILGANQRIAEQQKEKKAAEGVEEESPESQIEKLQEKIRKLQEEIEKLKQQGAGKEQIAAKQAQLTALQTQLLEVMQKQGGAGGGGGGSAGGAGGTSTTSGSDIAARMVHE